MTFGEEGKEGMPPLEYSLRRYGIHSDLPSIFSGARVHDLNEVKTILDIFQKHGHYEARILHLCAMRIESTIANYDHCTTHRLTRRLYTPGVRARSTSARSAGRSAGSLSTPSFTPGRYVLSADSLPAVKRGLECSGADIRPCSWQGFISHKPEVRARR